MADYSIYSYRRLLVFLKIEDKYNNEEVNNAEYLLTMCKASSIEDMLTIYNTIFEKISYYVFHHFLPEYWFITDSWGNKKYLVYELNECFNENIKRWYTSLEKPTKEDCVSCIVNLRESDNLVAIQYKIIFYKSFEDLHDSKIIEIRDESYNIRKKIRNLSFYSKEEYFKLRDEYVKIMDKIIGLGFQYTIEDKKFEEIRGIDVNKLIKFQREAKRRKREEEKRKLDEARKKDKKLVIILSIVAIIILITIFYLIIKIGFLGIIILIGFLGLVVKLFLTGAM